MIKTSVEPLYKTHFRPKIT